MPPPRHVKAKKSVTTESLPSTSIDPQTELVSYLVGKYFGLSAQIEDKTPKQHPLATFAAKDKDLFLETATKTYGLQPEALVHAEQCAKQVCRNSRAKHAEAVDEMGGERNVFMDRWAAHFLEELEK